MEVDEIKNIFYFIIAALWFVFSVYINNKTKKNKSQPKHKPAPNIFEEAVKEFKKAIEEVSNSTQMPETLTAKIATKRIDKNEIPDEVLTAQKRKIQRESALKELRNEKFDEPKNESTLLHSHDFQQTDLQKMVIFTEIFKRPNY